jgi:hypothetical protein
MIPPQWADRGWCTSSQLAGVVFRGCWDGSLGFSWRYLRVPPVPLGDWDTDDTPHLPPKCPWQNLPQHPRKPGHHTAGGGCGPGVRAGAPPPRLAAHGHPGRSPPGWLGRGDHIREGAANPTPSPLGSPFCGICREWLAAPPYVLLPQQEVTELLTVSYSGEY